MSLTAEPKAKSVSLLTAVEVAEQLGVSARFVYDLFAAGDLRGYRFGRALRFDPADLEAYKVAHGPTPKPQLSATTLRKIEEARLRIPIEDRPPCALTAEQIEIVARRARRMRMPPWADGKAIRALQAEARRLSKETGIPHQLDHVIPLQGDFVSGLHVETNMQILTGAANSRKRNRFEIEP